MKLKLKYFNPTTWQTINLLANLYTISLIQIYYLKSYKLKPIKNLIKYKPSKSPFDSKNILIPKSYLN